MKKFLKIFLAVIALIGIIVIAASLYLAPNFKNFEQKAKDQMAQAVLMNIYTAAHTTAAELGSFPPTLKEIGFTFTPKSSEESQITYQGHGKTFSASYERDGVTYTIDQDKKTTRTPPLKE